MWMKRNINMNKESLRSFVKLCKRGCIEETVLVAYFPEFAESGSTNAYDWYVSKGVHNLYEPISPYKLGMWIGEATIKGKDVVGYCMQKSGGKLNPNYVREVYKELEDEIH
jgi:hypothetical protein